MTPYICIACGTQHPDTPTPPAQCAICEDERQYVNWQGQSWTTLAELQQTHHNVFRAEGPGLMGIGTDPKFAIGQRALLVQTSAGNLLWDCISLIDEATIQQVQALGGLAAIAISHPHYYSSMVAWSQAFGNIPIYLHEADRFAVVYPAPNIVFWSGETYSLFGGITLIRCGGHFPGGTVAHWPDGDQGAGALLSGDIIQVVPDRRYVSFMWSFPNYIPLHAAAVNHIVDMVRPYRFKGIYGAWWDWVVANDGNAVVEKSAARYLRALQGLM